MKKSNYWKIFMFSIFLLILLLGISTGFLNADIKILNMNGIPCLQTPYELNSDRKFLIAVYLPWFTGPPDYVHWKWADKDPEQGEHASVYTPLLGLYDSREEKTVRAHQMQLHAAGVNAVIINWYGENNVPIDESTTMFVSNLPKSMGFALMTDGEPYRYIVSNEYRKDKFFSDIMYIAQVYMTNPNHLTKNLRPVLFHFPKNLINTNERSIPPLWWEQVHQKVKSELSIDFAYIEKDINSDTEIIDVSDGTYGWLQTSTDPEFYAHDYLNWFLPHFKWRKIDVQDLALDFQIFPVIWPGFDDSGVYSWTDNPTTIPRITNREIGGVKTINRTYDYIRYFNLSNPNFRSNAILVATFNDLNEGSQIEATLELGMQSLKDTAAIAKDLGREYPELSEDHFTTLNKYLVNIDQLNDDQRHDLEIRFFNGSYDDFLDKLDLYLAGGEVEPGDTPTPDEEGSGGPWCFIKLAEQ